MVLLISIIFIVGYLAIALEHSVKINKAAIALVSGVLCWSVYALLSDNHHEAAEKLTVYLGEVAGILFFFIGRHDHCRAGRCTRRL
jgi:hypothetical protein